LHSSRGQGRLRIAFASHNRNSTISNSDYAVV
jgi:hypothetical protein